MDFKITTTDQSTKSTPSEYSESSVAWNVEKFEGGEWQPFAHGTSFVRGYQVVREQAALDANREIIRSAKNAKLTVGRITLDHQSPAFMNA